MLGRKRGHPLYPQKTVRGSHILTKTTHLLIKRAQQLTGRSYSEILEHCVRAEAPHILPGTRLIGRKGTFPAATEQDREEFAAAER